MDIHKDKGVLLMELDLIKYITEVISMGDESHKNIFNAVYNDISEAFGVDVAIQIYQTYKGMQITFPTRLFNPEYVKNQVPIEYDGENIKQLAELRRKFDRKFFITNYLL